jgi:hypothetical protein
MVDSDSDGLVDDPDDEAHGAHFTVTFDTPVCLHSVALIDIESRETGDIELYDEDGDALLEQTIPGLGGNTIQVVDPYICGVAQLDIYMCGSGAVDDILFSLEEEVEEEVCLDYDYTCEETECEEVEASQVVETFTDFDYACNETECVEGTDSVTTEVCAEDRDCHMAATYRDAEECVERTFTKEVEFCVEVPTYEAELVCTTHEEEKCEDVTVCEEDCSSDPWVSGGAIFQEQ